ncbi:MAG TPA: hypothetical protein VNO26_17125 [Candidatus Limnocylindria bacterium]|nr:hypothetical protein [Candidatus Limnocylindria bacterium]
MAMIVLVLTVVLALVFRRPPELHYAIWTTGLTVLSLVVPGGRVLTIPFALVLLMIWLFWLARRAAEREEL